MAEMISPTIHRPAIMANEFVASTGHYLATAAATEILRNGGNAIDAGVAGGLCINVLQPDLTNLGGVAPIILYSAEHDEVVSISGVGPWPQAASIDFFVREHGGVIPPGIHRTVVPAAVDCWLTALERYGTMSLAEVAAPAITLAERGFPVYPALAASLASVSDELAQWPSTAEIYLPHGRAPRVGEQLIQKDLAKTLRMLVEAEEGKKHLGRAAGIRAARDRFYQGDIAEHIAAFYEEQQGFLTLDDLKNFHVDVERPLSVGYRGYDVYGCQPWCQGPVVLETLSILEGYDLAALGHNSADSLHLILESLKAAFADRERYIGDPKFVDVPVEGMLHPDYAAQWRERIRHDVAAPGMPEPGDPWPFHNGGGASTGAPYVPPQPRTGPYERDTSYLCVVDAQGNAFSATPSDVIEGVPVVPGLGIIMSGRGGQSRLDPELPSSLAPGKRPRLTPNPGLIMRDGKVVAPYGTPGLDVQPQAMVQVVVNLIDFGMDPQAAVEAPRLATYSVPSSSAPHAYTPGLVMAESRMPSSVLEELARRGHDIQLWPDLSPRAGSVCLAMIDHEHGILIGGADPRRNAYAMGW